MNQMGPGGSAKSHTLSDVELGIHWLEHRAIGIWSLFLEFVSMVLEFHYLDWCDQPTGNIAPKFTMLKNLSNLLLGLSPVGLNVACFCISLFIVYFQPMGCGLHFQPGLFWDMFFDHWGALDQLCRMERLTKNEVHCPPICVFKLEDYLQWIINATYICVVTLTFCFF